MYWVHWNTRNARLARKSLAESRPATGRSVKPVRSEREKERENKKMVDGLVCSLNISSARRLFSSLPLRKRDTSSSWGMLSGLYPQCLSSRRKASRYSVQAWETYKSLSVE